MKKILGVLLLLIVILVFFYFRSSLGSYNVLLISIDTLRADYLSCYNPKAAPTPNIDLIARRGVLFEKSYSLIPITLPSHSAMLTSISPHRLRVFNNGDHLDEKIPRLTDYVRPRKYETGAFISLGVLKSSYGLSKGFYRYHDNFEKSNGRYYKFADEVNADFLPWLHSFKRYPWFAFVHYSDPHEPYINSDAPPDTQFFAVEKEWEFCFGKKEKEAVKLILAPGENVITFRSIPPRFRRRQYLPRARFLEKGITVNPPVNVDVVYDPSWTDVTLPTGTPGKYFTGEGSITLINKFPVAKEVTVHFHGGLYKQRPEDVKQNYAAEVAFVDREIGRVWKKLDEEGLLDNTIIVLTSDHGEGLKDHTVMGHVEQLWREMIHVPLIIYHPGFSKRGARVGDLTSHLDIAPTILDMLGMKKAPQMEGESLKPYIVYSPFSDAVKRQRVYSYTFAPESRVNSYAITTLTEKLIYRPLPTSRWPWEYYDLKKDPFEKQNLVKLDPKRWDGVSTIKKLLEDHKKEADEAHRKRNNPVLSIEEQEMLRNLGYIDGSTEQ